MCNESLTRDLTEIPTPFGHILLDSATGMHVIHQLLLSTVVGIKRCPAFVCKVCFEPQFLCPSPNIRKCVFLSLGLGIFIMQKYIGYNNYDSRIIYNLPVRESLKIGGLVVMKNNCIEKC